MTSATMQFQQPSAGAAPATRGELALSLQEAFTVAARLRAGRQGATDAASFRVHIKQILSVADKRARAAGYDGDTVKLAVYAYIALLDESVLTSAQPLFSDWSRQPLQEEIFGEHMAGENFFRTLEDLLRRQDSEVLGDVLEVYQLCLLLGFRGRYALGDTGKIHAITSAIQTRVQRLRGGVVPDMAPDWQLPAKEKIVVAGDLWSRRLMLMTAGILGFALLLYVIFYLMLRSGVSGVGTTG
jgi:type VI secretion system protein ImpK